MATSIGPTGASARHDQIIETIAQEMNAPLEHVREIYESEFARLAADARVKTYVSVIATRLVKSALQAKP